MINIENIENLILEITKNEVIPLICLGIVTGFALCTVISLLAYGIFKAFSLVNILRR